MPAIRIQANKESLALCRQCAASSRSDRRQQQGDLLVTTSLLRSNPRRRVPRICRQQSITGRRCRRRPFSNADLDLKPPAVSGHSAGDVSVLGGPTAALRKAVSGSRMVWVGSRPQPVDHAFMGYVSNRLTTAIQASWGVIKAMPMRRCEASIFSVGVSEYSGHRDKPKRWMKATAPIWAEALHPGLCSHRQAAQA
jgi:hypothetical protein